MKTREDYLSLCKSNGLELEHVPEELKDREMCLAACQNKGAALEYVPEKFKDKELCSVAYDNYKAAPNYMPAKIALEIALKPFIADDIMAHMQGATAIILLKYSLLTVDEDKELRRRMQLSSYAYKLYKNIYLRVCFEGTVYEVLYPHLVGSTAVVFSYGDYNELENIIYEFSKTTKLSVKGAVIDNIYYDADTFYSKVKKRQQEEYVNEHIHEMVIGGLRLPITRLERILKRVLKQKQKEERERELDAWNDNYIQTHGEEKYKEILSHLTWEVNKYNNKIMITGIDFTTEEIWIPTKINGIIVDRINLKDNYDFNTVDPVRRIHIPSSITYISDYAFQWRSSLEEIQIPRSVLHIGTRAFSPKRLNRIIVEDGNPIYTSKDSKGNECNGIIEISTQTLLLGCSATVIPEGTVSIKEYSFMTNNTPRELTIPKSIQTIDASAFLGAGDIKHIMVDPGNDTYTSRDSKGNECNTIIDINNQSLILGCNLSTVPEGITTIGRHAFQDCTSLERIILPKGVKTISEYSFSGCTQLMSVELPEGLTHIEERAFSSCDNLEQINLPESLEYIGSDAFGRCNELTDLTIPKNVRHVEPYAFTHCWDLSKVTILSPYLKDLSNVFKENVEIIYAAKESPSSDGELSSDIPLEDNKKERDDLLAQLIFEMLNKNNNDSIPDIEEPISLEQTMVDEITTQIKDAVSSTNDTEITNEEDLSSSNEQQDDLHNNSTNNVILQPKYIQPTQSSKKKTFLPQLLMILIIVVVLALGLLGVIYEIGTGF